MHHPINALCRNGSPLVQTHLGVIFPHLQHWFLDESVMFETTGLRPNIYDSELVVKIDANMM